MRRRSLALGLALMLWLLATFVLSSATLHWLGGSPGQTYLVGPLLAHGSGAERLAPLAVLLLLGAVALSAVGQARRLMREEGAVARLAGVNGGSYPELPAGLRAARRARLLAGGGEEGAVDDAVVLESGLDAAAIDNRFRGLKTLTWTLPVVGFMGTAWGMAGAIGGFSDALTAARGLPVAEQLTLLTERLAQLVIPGLAGAFSVTILALGATVVAHFWVTTLEGWDHEVLQRLDEVSFAQLGGQREPERGISWEMRELMGEIRSLTSRLEEHLGGQALKAAADAHQQAATALKAAAEEMARSATLPYHVSISRGGKP